MGACQSAGKFDDPSTWPANLKANAKILSAENRKLVSLLMELNQEHVFASWDPPGTNDHKKKDFFKQIKTLHQGYPIKGGLKAYVERARELLKASKLGLNPFDGWTPEIPQGVRLTNPFSPEYERLEHLGVKELGSCGFVLVAGGLGERLGYSSIKIGLPSESITGTCYLELYCKQIKAIESRYAPGGRKLPLAIMVSDDTKAKTDELLKANQYFGLASSQVTLMKQEKVAALIDNDARIAMLDPYLVDAKPHGHGDVHSLMHSANVAQRWHHDGIKWITFFQDTNGLGLLTLPGTPVLC